jgi:hypothetical protein
MPSPPEEELPASEDAPPAPEQPTGRRRFVKPEGWVSLATDLLDLAEDFDKRSDSSEGDP